MYILSKILFIISFIILNKSEAYFKNYAKYILNIKKLSIIIPVFNDENYLIESLNTVINQTLRNIEIICINDGATDNSSKILQVILKGFLSFIKFVKIGK